LRRTGSPANASRDVMNEEKVAPLISSSGAIVLGYDGSIP
jgi:hypothetical protein